MKNENLLNINVALINKYFGKNKESLMDMKLSEILFLMEESTIMEKEDVIGFNLINKVPVWKKFYKHYDSFLELGFTEEELNIGLANLGRDFTFFEKISVHKGREPHNYYYEFISTGEADFLMPRTRSNRTERLPADFYNVSKDNNAASFSGDLFEFLILKRLPFLSNYKINIYNLDFYDNSHDYVFVTLNKGTLYVPLKALINLDSNLIVERMVDYFDKTTKHSYGKSEDLLKDPIALEFFNDINSFKMEVLENKNQHAV